MTTEITTPEIEIQDPVENVEIVFATDTSGSMSSIASTVSESFARFIKAQREIPGRVRVTQVLFNTQVKVAYEGLPIERVPALKLDPHGGTALYDAVGKIVDDQFDRIVRQDWADLVIVVIITDGQERDSKVWTKQNLSDRIWARESGGWKFVFLAADQDAFAEGRQFGMSQNSSMNYQKTKDGTTAAYDAASDTIANMRLRKGHPWVTPEQAAALRSKKTT